ncbi:16S rRNA (guanine966-N2)-methyltransferase [Pseudoalteromonas ulvae UL12]|uniref:16S rRNA (guanine(966)-N(2))-methyltransferase RsmD n=1 Tax=Pseudoalteromonas ulvae TaxID=107327 RepID=UPI00186B7365|nr:16S rRNA (guanine(966)-N(2))-methyltransferase RsmD [Pseudoalteromonas ulvae]MBE0365183.1 16S rRNA (guanine966-N2)-methyltransferase [Pseudoalteromonas ulvae UL12]
MKKNTGKTAKAANGHIRIISGQFKGRKLPVKDVIGLRPTADRVKETVFNWLMNDIRDADVLDCFAGSGGLGFEALSRYANSVTFIEKDKAAAQQLNDNLALLKQLNGKVIHADALGTIERLGKQYDLVFIDPPFRLGLAQLCCQQLIQSDALKPLSLIYVEVESELNDFQAPNDWQLLKEKTAGQVTYRLFQNLHNEVL